MRIVSCAISWVIVTSFSSSAFGFNYKEHHAITSLAFIQACVDFKRSPGYSSETAVGFFCDDSRVQYVAECTGHMTALAGDYAASPDDFHDRSIEEGTRPRFLENRRMTCHRFLEYLFQGACIENRRSSENLVEVCPLRFDDDPGKLLNGSVSQYLKVARLLTSNAIHFQPQSADQWSTYFDLATRVRPETSNLDVILANHGFALHFLQDSFSAGHNGLNRLEYDHDYDNGYHDTFNHTGIFLESKQGVWHTYGDQRLGEESNFVRFTSDQRPETPDELRAFALSLCGAIDRHCGRPEDEFVDYLSSTLRNGNDAIVVISLQGMFSWIRPCGLVDGCNKSEFILVDDEEFVLNGARCREVTEEYFVIRRCDSTFARVRSATKQSFLALFSHLTNPSSDNPVPMKDEVADDLALAYRPLRYPETSQGVRNGASLLLTYGADPIDLHEIEAETEMHPLNFEMWGLALEQKTDTFEELSEDSVQLQLVGSPVCFREERQLTVGAQGLISQSGEAFSVCPSVSLRVELMDSSGDFVDSLEVSMLIPLSRRFPSGTSSNREASTPRLRNVFGLGGIATAGIDELFQSSLDRNPYVGLGLTFDLFLGKQNFHLDVERLKHWNTLEGTARSSRVIFGWRGLSVQLSPR